MKANEKRRAVRCAVEQLERDGAIVESVSTQYRTPIITISNAPKRLARHAHMMREQRSGMSVLSYTTRQSGCIVRWFEQAIWCRDQSENQFINRPQAAGVHHAY